jgi:DHA1 family bicyclomycin/chloramphenicol resistance-like MFS transporter
VPEQRIATLPRTPDIPTPTCLRERTTVSVSAPPPGSSQPPREPSEPEPDDHGGEDSTYTGSLPTFTGSLPSLTGSIPALTGGIPTVTAGIPVLEDEADSDLGYLPTEQEYASTRSKVTALVIAVLTTISAIGPLATDMYVPAFPAVTGELGTTAARMQLTLTAFFMGAAAGQVVAGPLSDRVGRRAPLLFGISLCLLASIGCMLSPSIGLMLLFRILQGFGGGFGMVLGRAVVIDLTDGPELFRVMNLMQGVGGIAPIAAPLAGGLIMLGGHWRTIFLVIVVMSLLSLLGTLFLIPESLPASRRHSGGFRTFLTNVRTLLSRKRFVSYMLGNAFSAFALMAYVSASSFILQNILGFSPTGYSIAFAINSGGMMLMAFVSARLVQTHHPRHIIRVGLTFTTIAALALLVAALFLGNPVWVILPAFFLTVAPQGLISGNTGALASSEASEFAGTGSAMLGLGFSFAASAAAPIVGIAGDATTLPMALAMVGGSIVSVLCFVIAGRSRSAHSA